MPAGLEDPVVPVPGVAGGGLGLALEVGEVGLAERALDDLDVEPQVRGEVGVEGVEQEAPELLAARPGQARAAPDRTEGAGADILPPLAAHLQPVAHPP